MSSRIKWYIVAEMYIIYKKKKMGCTKSIKIRQEGGQPALLI